MLDLSGITVTDVRFCADAVVVGVRLRSRLLRCPWCAFTTKARYDTRGVPSTWRHPDLAARRLRISADLRRLYCPVHGVITEGVPFARPGSRFTRDFEDLVGWLATTMDKTALARLVRVDWDTTGRIIERVVGRPARPGPAAAPVPGRVEVDWRKGHSYLTLVSNHETGKFVWGREGKDAATLNHFFDDLGADHAEAIQAVSMDMSPAFRKSVSTHAGQAVICYDPFHVVALATTALDKVRRQVWQELRKLPDQDIARRFRGARWALMKSPSNLTDHQAGTPPAKSNAAVAISWRAYSLKEPLRAVFAGDLTEADVGVLLDRFCARASRSRLAPFVTLARTIRKRRAGILAAIRLGITNARHEGLNRRVRLIVNRAYGFHSANAALGLIMLTLGPINHVLPHERTTPADPLNRPTFMPGGPEKGCGNSASSLR